MYRFKFLRKYFFILSLIIFNTGNSQYISVDTSTYTPEQLVKNILIGSQNSSCITISNVNAKGWQDFNNTRPSSYGYFEKGSLPFDINKGIILSTGSALKAKGPNTTLLSDGDNSIWEGDSDLSDAMNDSYTNYKNATYLEFDFVAHLTTGISFQYMFLSEEYRTSNCKYSDAFAFLIKESGTTVPYENIAVVPGTTQPVSTLSINGAYICEKNIDYFGGFNFTNPSTSPTNFNGQTKVLTAVKNNIIPGKTYHIKLVIADHLNYEYDSAVFLKAGSFVGKKDLGGDLLFETDNPLCEGNSKLLNATTPGATYQWFKDGNPIAGATNATYLVQGIPGNEGNYEVEIYLGGCLIKGTIQIDIQKKPTILLHGAPSFCDAQFSGVPINFSQISQQIIPGFNRNFVPKYYLTPQEAQTGTTPGLQNGWLLTQTTKLYVRVESAIGCNPVIGETILTVGNKISLTQNSYSTTAVCDNNFLGVSVNLGSYVNQFTGASVTPTFYNSLGEAKIGDPTKAISPDQTLSSTKNFGVRLEGADCPNVATLTINIKSPTKSTTLKDEIICPGSKITLNAGSGFDYYKWSIGKEGDASVAQKIEVSEVGDYWVELTSNGCFYKHTIKISAAELPQITQIEVSGSTVTVSASGGIPPYRYSLDGVNFQNSPIFLNVPRGKGTVYLKDSQGCASVSKEFLIINLFNVITPNGDGKNDVLNYSDLKLKENVKMEIFDRYGNLVFISKDQQFIWDGSSNGKTVGSGTYWYNLSWTEPNTNIPILYKGWILVKNRN